MTTSQKINDIYITYLLLNRNIDQTFSHTKVSKATLRKYIKLCEKSHFSLLSFLDLKYLEKGIVMVFIGKCVLF